MLPLFFDCYSLTNSSTYRIATLTERETSFLQAQGTFKAKCQEPWQQYRLTCFWEVQRNSTTLVVSGRYFANMDALRVPIPDTVPDSGICSGRGPTAAPTETSGPTRDQIPH